MLTERTSKRKVTFQEPSTTCVVLSTKFVALSTRYQEPRTQPMKNLDTIIEITLGLLIIAAVCTSYVALGYLISQF